MCLAVFTSFYDEAGMDKEIALNSLCFVSSSVKAFSIKHMFNKCLVIKSDYAYVKSIRSITLFNKLKIVQFHQVCAD